MFQGTRNIKSILWGQGTQKFPVEQMLSNSTGMRVHTSTTVSRESLIELALCLKPDLVIFDSSVQGDKPWSAYLSSLKEHMPNVGFVGIIGSLDAEVIQDLARSQVDAIIQADKIHFELPYGIRAYQKHETYFNSQVAKVLCASLGSMNMTTTSHSPTRVIQDRGLLPTLTNREMEVLACLTQGLNYKQIAEKLFVSSSTVKTHVNNIFTKLNINDRTQAVLYGLRHGIDQMVPNLFGEQTENTQPDAMSFNNVRSANVQTLQIGNNIHSEYNTQQNNQSNFSSL